MGILFSLGIFGVILHLLCQDSLGSGLKKRQKLLEERKRLLDEAICQLKGELPKK